MTNQIAAPLTRLWPRLRAGVEHALQARATRQALSQLDERMLKDLGISHAQAVFQASDGRSWRVGAGNGD